MKHVSLLVPRGIVTLGCIDGVFRLLSKVNARLVELGRPREFAVQLVGLTREPEVYDGFFSVRPQATIDEVAKTDLIVVPAVNGDPQDVIRANGGFLPWIVRRHESGAEVASLCVGAFLLAATGLLNGRKCATHWTAIHEFRKTFPNVRLATGAIITDEAGVYSSGGALSFWNLLLYLVEKYVDRDMAVFVSKFFEIEIDRDSQSDFLIFRGQKDHSDESVRKVQEFIEGHYPLRITLDRLCDKFALGRRSLERRFKHATGDTVAEYVQRVKMEAAKKILESGKKTVLEVMDSVGYADSKAFRTAFRRVTGLSPQDYRSKYRREGSHAEL